MSEVTNHGQCPTCGRVAADWSAKFGASKGRQRVDTEDRAAPFRDWRRSLGRPYYVCDIDQVEWRMIDGRPVPVAVMELTRVDGNVAIPATYLEAILTRFTKRDGQGAATKAFAELMGVKAWIVLFRWDMSELWLYNLTDGRGWWRRDKRVVGKWIEGMGLEEEG